MLNQFTAVSENNIFQVREKFKNIVHQIVFTELDELQQQQFELEGEEIINNLFAEENIEDINKYNTKNFDFGISPEMNQLLGSGIQFISLIISCFTLYLEFKKQKANKVRDKFDEIELTKKFKESLSNQNIPESLKDAIAVKYNKQVKDLIDML